MKVPFVDLKAQYEFIKEEIDGAIQQVVKSSDFVLGEEVRLFENEFASYCGVQFGVGVGSGTDALFLALQAFDIGPGDEVITVPNTFIATTEAICRTGATPVFVDIDPKTYTMDPQKLQECLETRLKPQTSNLKRRPKAIIPVHLYGLPADMDAINEIAREYGLKVIEDACQAHGAEYKGKKTGSLGDAACFSFYPSKNLGAFGDGGMIVTNDKLIWRKARMLGDHGQSSKNIHRFIGSNSRLDSIQAAVLRAKLKRLDEWNEARRNNAKMYDELLADVGGLVLPNEVEYAKHVYHIYAIRIQERDALISLLAKKDIHCGIHYPVPVHLQKACRFPELKNGSFPVTEKCAEELVSLPMFPELTREQIEHVVASISEFLRPGEEYQSSSRQWFTALPHVS
jgi:dTDP-4-amino-4,6-dideoxygalactose transaminase